MFIMDTFLLLTFSKKHLNGESISKQTQDANTRSIDNFKPNSLCLARLKIMYNRVIGKKSVRGPELDLAVLTSNLK